MKKIKENLDIISIGMFLILFISGVIFANAGVVNAAFFWAVLGSIISKDPTGSKQNDERDTFIISKSAHNAYVIMLFLIGFWYFFSFEKNILLSLNLTIEDTLQTLFAFLYLSYNASYAYYRRKY